MKKFVVAALLALTLVVSGAALAQDAGADLTAPPKCDRPDCQHKA